MTILDLPVWLVGVLVVGGAAALGVALVYGLDVFVKQHRGEEHNQAISDGFQAVATMYAIVAGLLVFGVYTTFESSSQDSATEASTLVLMYRSAQAFPQPERDQAQQAVVAYIHSVIDDEWPALADGAGSPEDQRGDGPPVRRVQPDDAERPVDRPVQPFRQRPRRRGREAPQRANRPRQGVTAADLLVPALRRRLRHPALRRALLRSDGECTRWRSA